MPKVGGQHFAYTPAGKAKAKAKAKATGQSVQYGNKPKRDTLVRTPSAGRRSY